MHKDQIELELKERIVEELRKSLAYWENARDQFLISGINPLKVLGRIESLENAIDIVEETL